jgi:hypothetical protein
MGRGTEAIAQLNCACSGSGEGDSRIGLKKLLITVLACCASLALPEPVVSYANGLGKTFLHMANNFISSVSRRSGFNFSVGASGTDASRLHHQAGSDITMHLATLGNVDRGKVL